MWDVPDVPVEAILVAACIVKYNSVDERWRFNLPTSAYPLEMFHRIQPIMMKTSSRPAFPPVPRTLDVSRIPRKTVVMTVKVMEYSGIHPRRSFRSLDTVILQRWY